MIGVTIATDSRYYAMALEAAQSVNKYGNIPTTILTKGIHKEWWLWKSDLFELFHSQTIFYFDADTIMLQYRDLTQFDDQEEFIAVPDKNIRNSGEEDLKNNVLLNPDTYFNSGVMIFNNRHKEIAPWVLGALNKNIQTKFKDQTYWNLAVLELGLSVRLLGYEWNQLQYTPIRGMSDGTIIGHYTTLKGRNYRK